MIKLLKALRQRFCSHKWQEIQHDGMWTAWFKCKKCQKIGSADEVCNRCNN